MTTIVINGTAVSAIDILSETAEAVALRAHLAELLGLPAIAAAPLAGTNLRFAAIETAVASLAVELNRSRNRLEQLIANQQAAGQLAS